MFEIPSLHFWSCDSQIIFSNFHSIDLILLLHSFHSVKKVLNHLYLQKIFLQPCLILRFFPLVLLTNKLLLKTTFCPHYVKVFSSYECHNLLHFEYRFHHLLKLPHKPTNELWIAKSCNFILSYLLIVSEVTLPFAFEFPPLYLSFLSTTLAAVSQNLFDYSITPNNSSISKFSAYPISSK